MKKYTKIIATVGPATANPEKLIQLYQQWVNVIRFNFSHADHASASKISNTIHELNTISKTSLSLLLDTKWPEIRTGDLTAPLSFEKGELFVMTTEVLVDHQKSLLCDYPFLIEDVDIGQIIEIDSGLFHTKVIEKNSDHIVVEALNDATIGSRRHVNLPWVRIRLPGITEKDKEDILFAINQGFHFVAASFIRTKENVLEIKQFLRENNAEHIRVISKIENQEWVENLEPIVSHSDGIMVARWDLGIEVPIERVPKYQKHIIDLCRKQGKFVIVATHMLESMIDHPFPTRAEVSDIFRAVLQWADATMLSGETTTGKYPLQSVKMMTKVIQEAEWEINHNHHEYNNDGLTERDLEKKYLLRSALHVAENLGIKKVLIFTQSGRLARLIAAYRPNVDIHAFTPQSATVWYMRLLYGVIPHYIDQWSDHESNLDIALQYLLEKNILDIEDRVIAVTDIIKNNNEIPIMEIITVKDILKQ